MNDFLSIFLNYYNFNAIFFLIVCYLLLIGSIICVNLNKINYYFKNFEIFEKKKNIFFLNNFFLFRKQNLLYQSNINQNVRIIIKKK